MLQLRFLGLNRRTITFPDSKKNILLGTAADCDVILAGDDILSHHAQFYYDMSTWWIKPLAASASIVIDENVIDEEIYLFSDTVLTVGEQKIQVKFPVSVDDREAATMGIIDIERPVNIALPNSHLSEVQRLKLVNNIQKIALRYRGEEQLEKFISTFLKLFNISDNIGEATILLYDNKELIPIASSEPMQANPSFTLSRRVLWKKRAFTWERKTASGSSAKASSLKDVASALYVPIIIGKEVKGVIQLKTNSFARSFDEQDLDQLVEIATDIGDVIQHTGEKLLKKSPSAFISYSHTDRQFIDKFANDLRRETIRVWYDERISGGDNWRDVLKNAIQAADIFIVVLSPTAVVSRWVNWEIDFALGSGKPILPILYEKASIPDSISHLQYLRLCDDRTYHSQLATVIHDLRRKIDTIDMKEF